MKRLFLTLFLFLIATPALAHPWEITTGRDKVALYEMPKDGKTYLLSRVYYDAVNRRFMLDILAGPEKTIGTTGRHAILVLQPDTRASKWVGMNPQLLSTQSVLPLPPAGVSMFLNSAISRIVGSQIFDQPFGQSQSILRITEQPHAKVTTLKAPDGKGPSVKKSLGDGTLTWMIRNPAHDIIFTLNEAYTDNSNDYAGFWTPDGLYFFMILPDSAYLVLGPFQTDIMDTLLDYSLGQAKDNAEDEMKLDDRMNNGEITPAEHYGIGYVHLMDRLMQCDELKTTVGELKTLALRPPGSLQNFGYPAPVGKRLVFDYTAEKGAGVLRSSVITYGRMEDSIGKYSEWLQTITLTNKDGIAYLSCP